MSQQKKQKNKQQARTAVTLSFTTNGWQDYLHWKDTDANLSAAVDRLIIECLRTPYAGTGKPERLKGDLSGYASRRINKEHRLVYMFEDHSLTIIACRYHY